MWCNTKSLHLAKALTGSKWTKAQQKSLFKVRALLLRKLYNVTCVIVLKRNLIPLRFIFIKTVSVWCVSPPTGRFKKYTRYLVSLLAVSNSNEVYQLSTAIGYSVQGGVYSEWLLELLFWKSFEILLAIVDLFSLSYCG